MRLRNVKGSRESIASSEYVIQDPVNYKGQWKSLLYMNDHPLHVEIGMGKGQFIHTLAASNPDINYLGIEKFSSVLYRALEKRAAVKLSNLYFIRFDATNLGDIFADGEIQRIYLNFSDPWPKDRHAKRKLTSPYFLSLYENILAPDGYVQFKTDNTDLFNYSTEQIQSITSWKIDALSDDLHHSEWASDNVMTEYEDKFSSMGHPIHFMRFSHR